MDNRKIELDFPAEYPREVVVDIRNYVDFNWEAGLKKAIGEYEVVDDIPGGAYASFLAIPHLYVLEHVRGFRGRDEPKGPQRTIDEGGVCYNQAIVLCSLYSTMNIPTRKLKILSAENAHSTVFVGADLDGAGLSKGELDAALHEFYERNGHVDPPGSFETEPDAARPISFSEDVRDEYLWFLADPEFSDHLGDDLPLFVNGYVDDSSTERYWTRTTPHEIVIVDEDSVSLVGEEGLKDLASTFNEVTEELDEVFDELDRFEASVDSLSTLRRELTTLRRLLSEKRELEAGYERAQRRGDTTKAISLAADINETDEKLSDQRAQIEAVLSETSADSVRRFFDPDEIETINEIVSGDGY